MSFTEFRSAESSASANATEQVTIQSLQDKKLQGTPIVALTAYDYATARVVDEAGVDVLLVGDSLAMVVMGYETTLPVTVEEMLLHTRAVRRAVRRAMVVADLPFGSYQVNAEDGVATATRFLKEAGVQAVKIEGGNASREQLVKRLTEAEIPVVAHLGLTPQSVHKMSGYRVQGKSLQEINQLIRDALALEAAGAFAIVLEAIPGEVARRITAALHIPTIGIGAGLHCDGQILVLHDLINLSFSPPAKFVRRYADAGALIADAGALIADAVERYRADVLRREFPADQESYHLGKETQAALEEQETRRETRRLSVISTIEEMRRACAQLRAVGKTLGLVPTMGALHAGHLSLVKAAQADCDVVAVSVFVNPTQFGPKEDFAAYPRTLSEDVKVLEAAGVTLLFAPTTEEMYPSDASTFVTVEGLSDRLDGASRPGHFRGVATVVTKLLHIFAPDRAYFGQKDAAQVAVLRRMVRDLCFDVRLEVRPTVRESDGLAMSSRNRNLSVQERSQAQVLSRALHAARESFQDGEQKPERLLREAMRVLETEPAVMVEYCRLVDWDSLEDLPDARPDALLAIAARVGTTRLIDNTLL
jgi:3-methyl-2-oxobutanoate hydroxymethyltransferase